jgi:Arc/MetJ family transcription regulator
MRTNIVLDDRLVEEAVKISKAKSKREVVHLALQEFVENRKRLNLADLRGKVRFDEDYDHKKMREGK